MPSRAQRHGIFRHHGTAHVSAGNRDPRSTRRDVGARPAQAGTNAPRAQGAGSGGRTRSGCSAPLSNRDANHRSIAWAIIQDGRALSPRCLRTPALAPTQLAAWSRLAHMLDHHDAIIIGSGPTGGFCAKRLTEAGMNVLVLDAGASRLEQRARYAWSAAPRGSARETVSCACSGEGKCLISGRRRGAAQRLSPRTRFHPSAARASSAPAPLAHQKLTARVSSSPRAWCHQKRGM